VVYNELSESGKETITPLVDAAIGIAFLAYFLVSFQKIKNKKRIIFILNKLLIKRIFELYWKAGLFGYLAFHNVEIQGNVITNIPETFMRQFLIMGFIICVISGSAICIFPCRTTLNTFLFAHVKLFYSSAVFISLFTILVKRVLFLRKKMTWLRPRCT
jgi:hypothetical protein